MAEQRFLDEHGLELFWDEKVKRYTDDEVAALDAELATVAKSGDYDDVTDKPTITEQDLGVKQDGRFGPLGTSTTVTVEGDKTQSELLDRPFTTYEIDRIIAMAEEAGAL